MLPAAVAASGLRPLARFFLDGRLHAGESNERLRFHQGDDVQRAAGFDRAARGKAQGDQRFFGIIHDHQIDAHRCCPP